MKPVYIYDTECYRNYFLLMLVDPVSKHSYHWELHNDVPVKPLQLPECTMVGFNSQNYDHPMLSAAIAGYGNEDLKRISDLIILGDTRYWQHSHDLWEGNDQIDIINVLPGTSNLKIYGGRIYSKRLQDLPIKPHQSITYQMVPEFRRYCYNDCLVTCELYEKVRPQIELRERLGQKYGLELRSKSDAQIAEAVISSEYLVKTGREVKKPSSTALIGTSFKYNPPPFIRFETSEMQSLLSEIVSTEFVVGSKGAITLPPNLKNRIVKLCGKNYKLGIGGLHSVDKPGSFYADKNIGLMDIDVTSYYPAIIINCQYAPSQMADAFDKIYKSLVEQRLHAKSTGDKVTADTLKITINGSFGKLGNRYSKLYSPALLIHVTLTGQLALLMLIESLGSSVISANTDGITVRYGRDWLLSVEASVLSWEKATGFNMEWTPYASLHRRDVNNYLAITPDGKTKTKGIFAPAGLMKNPVNEVIIKAVTAKLKHGIEIPEFIHNHPVVQDFTSLRTVRGGAQKNGILYGKSVRWYWSTKENTAIYYQTSGNTVPTTERSRMMMDLVDEMPDDIDYQRYILEAEKLLEQITCK